MKQLIKDYRRIKNNNFLTFAYFLVSIFSYGYVITHETIGMDDTGIECYFSDGLAPQVGRWTLFLLNKIFHMSEFTPYFMDLLGVLLLVGSVIIYVILFKRVTRNQIGTFGCLAFGCLFLSSPFMGEVFIYYLHNGIGLSFFLLSLTGLCMLKVTEKFDWKNLLYASIFVSIAIGCYESFALVYLVQVAFVFLLTEIFKEEKIKFSSFAKQLGLYLIPLIVSVIVRKILPALITLSLGLEMDARGVSHMKYWFLNNPFVIAIDLVFQFILRYFVSGMYFFGVFVFALMMGIFSVLLIYVTIKKKNIRIFVFGAVMMIIPWLLIPVELVITPYRACQAVVFLIAAISMMFFDFIEKHSATHLKSKKFIMGLAGALFLVLLFNQGFSLNKYFYVDELKNKNDERVCREIALELERNYSLNKPVAFVGEYEMPKEIRKYVYLAPDSDEYKTLSQTLMFSGIIGFYNYVDNAYGYRIYEIGSQDPLAWMTWASLNVNSDEREIYRYFRMLGYSLVPATSEQIEKAREISAGGEIWPKSGSITETDEMIIVRVGKDR